jgi:ATP-dependent helicase/nuclease subunit A
MIGTLVEKVISTFDLTEVQTRAASERERDIVVTAGAGSGKTRTLVARYVSLLAEGFEPRRVVAVTFTEKAAREMRSRVRDALSRLTQEAQNENERQLWITLGTRMDAARIGTIHSLCAEILRAHPAEASIDPRFEVLDEGIAAALRAQIVEDTLNEFAEETIFLPLFTLLDASELISLMQLLLLHRLETTELLAENIDSEDVLRKYLERTLYRTEIADGIADLRATSRIDLEADKLYDQVTALLAVWDRAEKALQTGEIFACSQALYEARREHLKLKAGKRGSRTKEMLRALQEAFDEYLDPVVGGKDSGTQSDQEAEQRFAALKSLVPMAFERLSQNYREALNQRRALDFDDLEAGAAGLLAQTDIRSKWQQELDALLVDEFQDTNARQRRILEALAGGFGRLFIVGDARQSIYRFRRADVTVFRTVAQKVKDAGGLVCDLDLTYRTHEPLLQAAGDLLAGVMGTEDDPSRPYYVSFSQLNAHRKEAPMSSPSPHLEFVLGAGQDTQEARPVMARALAQRLLELRVEKQIRSWDDVALLFRASGGYRYYENAFEEIGIPFVTVAGGGFYNRPEIRDILNILRALADPTDDLAMAGLLRSPAFGLTDTALYLLRKHANETFAYWQSLQSDLAYLEESDQAHARRSVEILNQLLPQVDRIPVAELLKQLVDMTDYRAILASEGESNTGGRLWRNLDKLLSDTHASGFVNIREFLDYLDTLSEAGAREGEAAADAQGAVRLMTIHKSKGLEFPVVVLADAGRERRSGSEQAYLLPEIGLAAKLDPLPMLYRFAKSQDGLQNEAESLRILYVALTRAKDKLIISGHTTPSTKGEWKSSEWLSELGAHARVDLNALVAQAGTPLVTQTASGQAIRATVSLASDHFEIPAVEAVDAPRDKSDELPLFQPLVESPPLVAELDEADEMRSWRATGEEAHTPPGVIGQMVHKAIQLWLFPEDDRLIPMLESAVLNAGLATLSQRAEAVRRTVQLLQRFRNHPLWEEINSAQSRNHEIPYSRMNGERAETGYIDLLFCTPAGWQIVDFKTDIIRNQATRVKLIEQYKFQMLRYEKAVNSLLGHVPTVCLCFLDDHGVVNLVQASTSQGLLSPSLVSTHYSSSDELGD